MLTRVFLAGAIGFIFLPTISFSQIISAEDYGDSLEDILEGDYGEDEVGDDYGATVATDMDRHSNSVHFEFREKDPEDFSKKLIKLLKPSLSSRSQIMIKKSKRHEVLQVYLKGKVEGTQRQRVINL